MMERKYMNLILKTHLDADTNKRAPKRYSRLAYVRFDSDKHTHAKKKKYVHEPAAEGAWRLHRQQFHFRQALYLAQIIKTEKRKAHNKNTQTHT